MSKPDSWYAKLTELAGRYGEEVVRAAEQHLGTHLAQRPSEEQLAAIEHLAALRVTLGNWEAVERTARAIASGRPPHVGTEPQRAAIAVVPATGRRTGGRAAVVLIGVMSPTAGYATLATRCDDAIALSPKGRRALESAGIRYVYELVQRTASELGRLDGLAEDLVAIVRFFDRFGLVLGSKLDRTVTDHVREVIASKR